VMKNVAGYDLSRLMAGSYGCLGLVTEVSLKVLPKPRQCLSLSLEMDRQRALVQLAEWGQQPLPISAACHDGDRLHLRLEGGEGSVAAAHDRLGGEPLDPGYWSQLNEQQLDFFNPGQGLLDSPFQPLAPTLLHYHQRLKAQLDPQGIFNPGRLYVEL